MPVITRGDSAVMMYKQAGLVNREAVAKYVEMYGTPFCRCCGDITFDCLFRYKNNKWTVYCINCGLTKDAVGVCLHGNIKVIIIERRVHE